MVCKKCGSHINYCPCCTYPLEPIERVNEKIPPQKQKLPKPQKKNSSIEDLIANAEKKCSDVICLEQMLALLNGFFNESNTLKSNIQIEQSLQESMLQLRQKLSEKLHPVKEKQQNEVK